MVYVSKFQNDVAGWLISNRAQLLDERDVLFATADRHNAKRLVDYLHLHSLWVVLIGAVIHLQLNLEAITVPLNAKAILVYQRHSELVEVKIYFHFGNGVFNPVTSCFYFLQSLLNWCRHLCLKLWQEHRCFGSLCFRGYRCDNLFFLFLFLYLFRFLAWAENAREESFALRPCLDGSFVAIKLRLFSGDFLRPGFQFIVVNGKQDSLVF